MRIKTKILGTFSLLLALGLVFQAASYYLTKRSVTYQSLLKGEMNVRKLTLEAKHLYVQKMLAFSNYCLYPRESYMAQVSNADKAVAGKLRELERQLDTSGATKRPGLLKTILGQNEVHAREMEKLDNVHDMTSARKACLARIKTVEEAEAYVLSGLDEMEKRTLGKITAYKEAFYLRDWLSRLFPSFAPIIEARDNLLGEVDDLWTDLELYNVAQMRAIAGRRFLLTGNERYLSRHEELGGLFEKFLARGYSRQGQDDAGNRQASADAKEFNQPVEAAFGKMSALYRSGDIEGAEKTLLHSFVAEQMLESTVENMYESDLKYFEITNASIIPVTEYAISFNRQLLVVMACIALLAFITGYVFINVMLKPINYLRDASRSISEGDWSHRVPVRAKDEIGDMADSFNMMASGLETAEKALLKSHSDLSVLYKVSSAINKTIEIEGLFTEVLELVTSLEIFNVEKKASIFAVEGDNMRLISHLGHSEAFLDGHMDMKVGDCLCGLAAKSGEVVISPDSSEDERHTITFPEMSPHGHVIVPLKARDKVTGVMYLYTQAGAALGDDKIRMLTSIGNQLGIALDNAMLYRETRELALRDPLTGLANRRLMDVLLDKNFASAKRHGTPFSVVMMDIDYFKKYNDTYGHPAGDRMLADIARIILNEAREMDLVVRYGGEEFLILLPDANLEHAASMAERVRAAVGSKTGITVSLGIAEFRPGMKSREELIKDADTALYKAKETGRNRVAAFERRKDRAA